MEQPQAVHSVDDLRQLMKQYGPLLSDDNQRFILELISRLDSGGDPEGLMNLASRMNLAARRNS